MNKLHPSVIMTISLCSFFIGLLLMALCPVDQSYWLQTLFSFIVLPIGIDMNFASATVYLSNVMSEHNQGLGASLVNTFVNYSISIGLGVAAIVQYYNVGTNNNNNSIQYHTSFTNLYSPAFYTGVAFSALGVVISLVIVIHRKINRKDIDY